MSDRPRTGSPPRGAPGASADEDPSDVTAPTSADMPALEVAPRPRSRSLRAVGARPRTGRVENIPIKETRIMSANDVEPDDEPAEASDDDATHAGPPVTVEVLAGPDQGKKKRVRGGRMVVGRGDGCDLKLSDTATSRRHMELIVGFSGTVVRDLGSGNGTKVNGQKVDEAQVGHGDEIQIGTTILKIIDEVALLEELRRPKEPPPEVEPAEDEAEADSGPPPRDSGTSPIALPLPAPGGNRNTVLLVVLGVGALVIIGLLVMLLRPPSPPTGPQPAVHTPAQDSAVALLVQQGKAAIVASDFDKASQIWDQVEKLDPTNGDLIDLRARTAAEKDAKGKLATAQGMLAEHRFDEARDMLKSIAPESKASDEAAEIAKGLDGKQADFLLTTSTAKLASGDLAGAREGLAPLAHLDAAKGAQLSAAIDAAQADQDRAALANIKNKKQRAKMMAEMKRKKADSATHQELESGYRKFQEANSPGSYERAAAEFERISEATQNPQARSKAQALVERVRNFAKSLHDADTLEADQSYEAEVGALDKAVQALDEIEPSGPLMTKLKSRLVRGLILKGKSAAARQDYALSAKAFQRVLQLHPGDSGAKEGLVNLRARANDVYLQAYEEESRDPESAKKLYGSVLQMVGPDDEVANKAKRRLQQLNGGE